MFLTSTPSVFRSRKAIDQHMLTENRALVDDIDRRNILRGALSLGALTMLTGCDVTEIDPVQKALRAVSSWNDRVQEALFRPHHLAPTFSRSQVVKPPRFNAYYDIADVKPVNGVTWTWPASLATSGPGPRDSSMRCRSRKSSSGTFASKAGTTSGNGPARTCAAFSSVSAPI
jgi:hypothetical protein